jgi:hypothetical protein
MGRKRLIEQVEVRTLRGHTRVAAIRLDCDSGMLHSGLCGTPVVADHLERVYAELQTAADRADGIQYVSAWVIDTGILPLSRFHVNLALGDHRHPNDHAPGFQWRESLEFGLARVAKQVPPRWVIFPAQNVSDEGQPRNGRSQADQLIEAHAAAQTAVELQEAQLLASAQQNHAAAVRAYGIQSPKSV